jgi:hypothetical protein
MEYWSKYGVAKNVWCSKSNVAASGSESRDDGWDGVRRNLVRAAWRFSGSEQGSVVP